LQVECDLGWNIDGVVAALVGGDADAGRAGPRDAAANRHVSASSDRGRRLRRTQSDGWLAGLGASMRQWLENAKRETGLARVYRASGAHPTFAELLESRTIMGNDLGGGSRCGSRWRSAIRSVAPSSVIARCWRR
jgi:hypothetical protein